MGDFLKCWSTRKQLPDRAETFAQISFVPYLLSGPLRPEHLMEVATVIAKETGANQAFQTHIDKALVGPEHIQLYTEVGLVSLRIYLLPLGIGVLRIDWPAEPIPREPRDLLKTRRERHKEIIDGSSDVGAKAHTLAIRSRAAYHSFCGHFPAFPFNSSSLFDYVLSMYELCFAGSNPNSESVRTAEAALLEPSRLGISDTSWHSSLPLQVNTHLSKPQIEYPDLEMESSSQCRMSWASVVVSGTISQDHRELYTALQVRTQALWLLTHRISKIRPGVEGIKLFQLEILANVFEGAVRTLLNLDDPTTNERILKLHAGIVSTSTIEKRIQIARDNIESLRSIAMATENRRRARSEFVIELLLFIIASLQLLPVVVSTPLTGLWPYLMILFWALFLATFVLIRIRTH